MTSQGTDAGKKIVGRKRGIVTDTIGLILTVIVTAASLSDNAIGTRLIDEAKSTHPTITKVWVDTGFKASSLSTPPPSSSTPKSSPATPKSVDSTS